MTQTRNYYRLKDGSFVRTQGEIPKGEPVNKVSVPVDSHGLVDFLNNLFTDGKVTEIIEHASQPEVTLPPQTSPPPAATPFTLTDAEEFIQGADAARLARLSENVCYRIMELQKRLAHDG